MARIRLISEYECAVLSALRARAWWPAPVSEADAIRGAQSFTRTPARTCRHHLARFVASGLLEQSDAGYRWNPRPPELAAVIEAAAAAEGLPLAAVVMTPPVGPIRLGL